MQSIFVETSNQILCLFLIVVIGFIIKKTGVVNDKMDTCVSQLQSNVIMPALVFQAFYKNFKIDVLTEKSLFLIVGAVVVVITNILSIWLAKLFSKDRFIRNIYSYSFTVSNLGYMGYSVVGAVFGEEALFNMMIFCIPFNVYIYSIGIAILNPNNPKVSFKTLINPVFCAMILGAVIGIINIRLPEVIVTTCSNLAACMGPLAMLVAGFVIAKYDIKELFGYKKVYVASLIRLVAIPGIVVLVMKAFGAGTDILICAVGTLAMSLGLNTVIFPAAYGGDTKTGASMALISNILGVVTIPLMFALAL
ncbi:MAG: AEC family transporter [Clostridia bacterium]|nr:AEC family transporter [Clostridia bacterium]